MRHDWNIVCNGRKCISYQLLCILVLKPETNHNLFYVITDLIVFHSVDDQFYQAQTLFVAWICRFAVYTLLLDICDVLRVL